MKVARRLGGKDYHGAECDCGVCNSNGHAYEVAIVPVCEVLEDAEPLHVLYSCSEQSALSIAEKICQHMGWELQEG